MRRLVLALSLIAFTQTACFGSFAATRSLWEFNRGVSQNKWVQEAAFLGLIILPAYSLFALGDILIFNTIEFWGGQNPIADGGEVRMREVRLADGSTARLIEDRDGRRIEHGDRVYFVEASEGGLVLRDDAGQVISSVQEGTDGAVVLVDAEGAERVIPAHEVAAAGQSPEALTAWTLALAQD